LGEKGTGYFFYFKKSILSTYKEGAMSKQEEKVCANCGYTSTEPFEDDICPQCGQTFWKCNECGYTLTAETPPEKCPSCGKKCEFRNVTCYTPECGGPGHIDPRL
jgi:rubrerythrin